MVAPTPSLTFGVDLGDLPKNVKDIEDRIGIPTLGATIAGTIGTSSDPTTIAGAVQAARSQLGNVSFGVLAQDANTAATQAANAAAAGAALITAIGSLPAGTIAGVVGSPTTPGSIAYNVQATKNQLGNVDFKDVANNASAAATSASAAATAGSVLITAVGSPPEGQTIADTTQQTLNKVKDVDFDSLAANASTAATQATASVAAGNTLTGVIGDSSKQGTVAFNAQATWDKLRGVELTKFATQEDIAELRCLVLYLWWLDHGCRYLSTGVTDHPTGLVYEQIRIRDAPQDVTPDAFKSAAGAHQLEERLWPCDIDRLLQIVKAYHAHVSPSTPTARRQKT